MHFTNAQLHHLARAMLGLVLFAQCVVAAEACVMPVASPLQAFAPAPEQAIDTHEAAMQGEAMPCHEQPDANKNACLVHCSQSDQISADQAGPLFMHARNAVLVLDVPAVPAAIPLRFGIAQAARNLGPSIPIRFCTFLI